MTPSILVKSDVLETIELLKLVSLNAEAKAALEADRLIKIFQALLGA